MGEVWAERQAAEQAAVFNRQSPRSAYSPALREFATAPENPILVAFRQAETWHIDGPGHEVERALDFLASLVDGDWELIGSVPTPEQIDHARKVLLRIVALS